MPNDDTQDLVEEEEQTVTLFRTKKVTEIRWTPVPDSLTQIEGPGAPRLFPLQEARIVVGRSSRADIQIVSSMISRQHMFLWRNKDHELVCEDMDSQNGLLLNGIPIHAASLREGDHLQLGDIIFVYHRGSAWPSS